jgi:glycosyltransferase involved in cell wall biosynthesis
MKETKLSIVICTRNRPLFLNNLLNSINNSTLKPFEVVVVSSGEDISQILHQYSNSFTIKHLHTKLVGQSNQKKLAIKYLDQEVEWVFFLDDDLLIMADTISHTLEKIYKVTGKNIAGIGTQILSRHNLINSNEFVETKIPKNKLGTISKSGRANSYQNTEETETEWLNGASIWNKKVLQDYQLPILDSRYAAYEDVIFSTKVNKIYKLVYEPQIKIVEQISHNDSKQSISAYSYINLWTGYFVCIDARTKLSNFKALVILRFFKFTIQKIRFRNKEFKDTTQAFILAFKLITLPNDKVKSKEIILKLIRNEILYNL